MNHASRCAIVSLAALASAAPIAAAFLGIWPGVQPFVSLAVAGLALAGMLFHALLVRHLGAADVLARVRQNCQEERQARERAEAALAETHDALCRLMRQQEQVREGERKRIARDIHDDLGQHLLALKIELQLASHGAGPTTVPGATTLARLANNVDQTIAALRVVIDNLRPAALEDGLQVAIEQHLREFSRQNGIAYKLIAGLDNAGSPAQREFDVVLLRILRESLANVVRHAQATEVWVALKRGERDITLEIRDNGIGMAPAQSGPEGGEGGSAVASQGCGLAGIADRVAAVGGSFAIDSGPGEGTVLSMSIPLPQP
ncbi:MAG: sensor histidine kinase [Massilia sp.]